MRFTSVVACAGLVLFAALAFPLFARVENVVDVPLARGYEASSMTFVRILPEPAASEAARGRTHRTQLMVKDPGRVLSHGRVGLLVGTRGTEPDLESATLAFDGTRCVYRSAPGAEFPNNRTLDLDRSDGCAPLEGTPTGKVHLTVKLRNRARLVLWTHIVATATLANETMAVDPSPEPISGETLAPGGRLVDEGTPSNRHRRIDLLAYVWQVRPGSMWIWAMVGLGAFSISLGFLGLWNTSTGRHGPAAIRGVSAFLLTMGLGGLYAILTPPFQAPDEPHHFVAFADLAARPELVVQADEWAARGHVGRVRFRPAEKFTPSDVGQPADPWATPGAPDSSVRGGGIQVLWGRLVPLLRSMPAPHVFLWLRMLNVLVLAIGVAGSVALLVRYGQVPSPHLLAFPVLFIPTLPFFGMHVSNHGPVIAVYLLLSAGLALVVLNRKSDPVSGVMVGCGWAAAMALSRSAMPLAPMIAAMAGARLLFGPADRRIAAAMTFWAGLVLPVLFVLSTAEGAVYVAANTRIGAGTLPPFLQAPIASVTTSPWLLAFSIPLLAVLEVLFSRLRSRSGARLQSTAGTIARWSATAAAVIVTLLLIGSVFLRYPVLATVERLNRPDALEYTRDAVLAGLTMLRLAGPDYRTSVTFWGGFGWLETLPPAWFVSVLTGATGFALVGLLIDVRRRSDTRRAFFLAATLVGFASAMAAYAFSLTQVEVAIDIAGRYVFGLYLATVLICWSGISFIPDASSHPRMQAIVSSGCVIACTAVHAYCLRLILYRYF